MQAKHLKANVRNDRGVAVIDLDGEINSFSEEELNSAYAEATAQHPASVLLDFTSADYINSTGIALIVGLLAQELVLATNSRFERSRSLSWWHVARATLPSVASFT